MARTGSFTEAALGLHLSQSAVSQQVAALERELGAQLLARTGRRATVTPAGAALLRRAEPLLADLEAARRAVASAQGSMGGSLRIASSLTIAGYVLPRPLTEFAHEHPDVRLELRVRNTEDVIRALIAAEVDVGLVEGPVASTRVVLQPLLDDELAVIAPATHPFATADEVDPETLVEEPFVVREQGSGTRRVAEDALAAAGVDVAALHVVAELSGIEALKAVVEAGLGVSIASTSTIRRELALGTLVARPLRGLTMRRTLAAATLAGAPELPAVRALVAAIGSRGVEAPR